jgi:hypothetical protein
LQGSIGMSSRLRVLAARPVFTVGEVTYTWEGVLDWAAARGSLDELRRRSRLGLALAARPELKDSLEQGVVSAAATAFRRKRGLLSAEELDAWLSRWELTVHEWGEHLERTLLVDAFPEGAEGDVAEEALEEAEYVDAVCSGLLADEANRLATDVALAAVEAGSEPPRTIEETIAAAAAARRAATADAGIEREIARRALDWTRLDLDVIELEDEGAAREAAMCVRLDGRRLAEVAADCRAEVEHLSAYVSDLEEWAQPHLLAAQAGELVGPVEDGGCYVIFAVNDRTAPASTDPALRERAGTALVERATRRAVEARVEWHDDL